MIDIQAGVDFSITHDMSLSDFCGDLLSTDRSSGEPGVVVATNVDGVLRWGANGLADLEHAVAASPRTRFEIGSIAKQMTAAVLDRVLGDRTWDDPVTAFLPGAKHLSGVTLRQLADHRASVRDYDAVLALSGQRAWDLWSQADVLQLILRQSLPVEGHAHYSNSHYVILAEVVRALTGRSLADVADEVLFGVSGFHNAAFRPSPERLVPERACSYSPDPARGWRLADTSDTTIGPHGVYCDLVTLARWESMISADDADDELRDLVAATWSAGSPAGDVWCRGRTVRVHPSGEVLCGHGGSRFGFRSAVWTDVTGRTVLVLANRSDVDADAIADEVRTRFLPREAPDRRPAVVQPAQPCEPPAPLEEGTYWSRSDGAAWRLETPGPGRIELFHDGRRTSMRADDLGCWKDEQSFVRLRPLPDRVAGRPVLQVSYGLADVALTDIEWVGRTAVGSSVDVRPVERFWQPELDITVEWKENGERAAMRAGRGIRVLQAAGPNSWIGESMLVRRSRNDLVVDLPRAREICFVKGGRERDDAS